jgi:hypothetical protein
MDGFVFGGGVAVPHSSAIIPEINHFIPEIKLSSHSLSRYFVKYVILMKTSERAEYFMRCENNGNVISGLLVITNVQQIHK